MKHLPPLDAMGSRGRSEEGTIKAQAIDSRNFRSVFSRSCMWKRLRP